MSVFDEFLQTIDDNVHQKQVEELLKWVKSTFPELTEELKWNQPMFTHHGTYIFGFSTAKHHISVAPEYKAMAHFKEAIDQAGYTQTKGLFRIRFSDEVNKELLKDIIAFNIEDKKDCHTFWRK